MFAFALDKRSKNIVKHLKFFGIRSPKTYACRPCVEAKVETSHLELPKKTRFRQCTFSEPIKCKSLWTDRLQLPYYEAFKKIKQEPVELSTMSMKLNVQPNPMIIGAGLTRQNIMDEKLQKLVREYKKQREENIRIMKTQFLSGRELDDKIPEIKPQLKTESLNEDLSPRPKNPRIIRAI